MIVISSLRLRSLVLVVTFYTRLTTGARSAECDFQRLDGRMLNPGMLKKINQPVVLTNMLETWPARTRWATSSIFAQHYGAASGFARDHDQLELRDVDMTVDEYLTHTHGAEVKGVNLSSSAAFFVNDYEDSRLLRLLSEDYEVPPPLGDIEVLRLFSLERSGAGVALHRHESSWQALVTGRKMWYVVNASADAVTLQQPCSFQDEDGPPPYALQCEIVAGEVVYVPTKWWHATCTLGSEPSLAIGGVGSMARWPLKLRSARLGEDIDKVLADGGSVDEPRLLEQPDSHMGGERALYLAVAYGHEQLVKALLTRAADPELPRHDGRTPFHEAARRGDLPMLRTLLNASSVASAALLKTDMAGSTVLHHACAERGSPEVVEFLLGRGAQANAVRRDGRGALHVACRGHRNPVPLLRVLLKGGEASPSLRDMEGMTALMHCAGAGHAQGVGLLLHFSRTQDAEAMDDKGRNALHHALIGRGDVGVVQRLLAFGAKPAERSMALAARLGDPNLLRLLHRAGANSQGAALEAARAGHLRALKVLAQELRANLSEAQDDGGATPLHLAALSGHVSIVSYLLAERGASAARAADDQGLLPLHYAAIALKAGGLSPPRTQRRRLVAQALIFSGGNETSVAVGKGGLTALHIAAASGDFDLVRFFVEEVDCMDVRLLDSTNASAADAAEAEKHAELAAYLRELESRPLRQHSTGAGAHRYEAEL